MEVIFYSTHCPKCSVLEKKLKSKNIEYIENNNVDDMIKLGVKMAPVLVVDGEVKDFKAATDWVNHQEAK